MKLGDILPRLEGGAATLTCTAEDGAVQTSTFNDLHRDVCERVRALRSLGLREGQLVGLLAPVRLDWMAWDLALIECGCVSVALPHEPLTEGLDALADRLSLSLLIADPALLAAAGERPAWVVPSQPTTFAADRALRPAPVVAHAAHTHSYAFSSGTTGRTKGLIISSRGTERLLDLYEQAFGVVAGDRFLTFLPFANYQQRMAYYFCLYHGIDFVYVPFPRLFAGLKQFSPTYVIAPPVFYESMQAMASATAGPTQPDEAARREQVAARLRDLLGGRIRYLITGMAPIKRRTLDFFWAHGAQLFEAFGITEAGMVCWNKPGQVKLGTVGRPAEPGSVTLSPEGEVIISRDALLGLGYFDAPEEDARATFVAPGSVATGDIASFDDEGYLSIIGRKKDAIITKSGEKFHPETVESRIQTLVDVRGVVVIGADELPGLAAWIVVANPNDEATLAAIRAGVARVNEELPASQRVKRISFRADDFSVDNGLRTRNLKLNRKAILEAYLGSQAGGARDA